MTTKKEDLFEKSGLPSYNGGKIYRDMADNLSKIKFPVTVTESYTPNVHYSLLREGAPPPVFDPGPSEAGALCHASLSGDFIIDALCSGQYLSFDNPDDMAILADWIDKYLKSYESIDLTRFPDRLSFNANAKKALGMLRGNITRKGLWEQEVNPAPLTLAEIIANM
jgi:hypothetical protein